MSRVIPVVGICLVIGAMAMTVTPVAAQAEQSVVVTPATSNAEVGETIQYDIVLNGADGGVGAYEFTATVSNPDVATITEVSLNGEPSLKEISHTESGNSVDVKAALADTKQTGDITLASISIEADEPGRTDLNINDLAVGNEEGFSYEPTVAKGEMTVLSTSERTLAVTPLSESVNTDEETTANVALTDAIRGVGAYDFTLSISDSSVAEITDVSLTGTPKFQDIEFADNNDSVEVQVAAADTKQTGEVVIAAITITGNSAGETTLDLEMEAIGDEKGYEYPVSSVIDSELTVEDNSVALPPITDREPTDVDSDGTYEDLNGDGEATVTDIQLLYTERNSDVLQSNPKAVDFNEDGSFDVADIQALYEKVTS